MLLPFFLLPSTKGKRSLFSPPQGTHDSTKARKKNSTDINTTQYKMASTAPAIDPNQTIYVRNLNEKINKIGMFFFVCLSCAAIFYLPLLVFHFSSLHRIQRVSTRSKTNCRFFLSPSIASNDFSTVTTPTIPQPNYNSTQPQPTNKKQS